ncbi:hypothetical protein [Luteipulveratus halotolerans]|uniref:Pycsar effector protein domain-containing protein n=1 Tax=Luteipulveratus halotolerans TaxID=1631356 RepID=A0A0L6CGT0_9MICO|nr:hypothetical protein [Luteipulveratus halotolerans]KNX36723.1 hypothetical protein VV01_05495 [Luteipulveratus halotolerans]
MRRSRARIAPSTVADADRGDGAFQALDQIANWVRFADTKATLLTAGLGIVLSALTANVKTIANALRDGCPWAPVVGALAGATLLAVAWTVFWMVRAVGPQKGVQYAGPNRFAWPSLIGTSAEQLADHVRTVDASMDAWQQVVDLSALANRKFQACGNAVKGLAVLVVLGPACIALSIGVTN